jgi:hypothetical protein
MTKVSYFMTGKGGRVSGFGAAPIRVPTGEGFDHPFQLDLGVLVERAEDEAIVVVLVLRGNRVPADGGLETQGFPQFLEIEYQLDAADPEVVRSLEKSAPGGDVVNETLFTALVPYDGASYGAIRLKAGFATLLHISSL